MTVSLRGADGGLRPFLTRVMPHRDAEGRVLQWFGTATEITEQKQMEAALREATLDAERANRAKSKFLASASHDLRQPVQSLVLLLALIERQVATNPRALETSRMMKQALGGLNGLLTAILDISRLDAGVVAPAIDNVDLRAMVDRLSSEYGAKAADKGLELRVVSPNLHALADASLLERALRNLIENAIRYTPNGGVLIGLRRRGAQVRIDVVDTGIGVPLEKQQEIFDEFIQLNNPGRDLAKGLGLGLAIVARLAALLDARVEVSSRVGRGSRFSLSLPAAEAGAPSEAQPVQLDDPRGRILIIEDNLILRRGLESIARKWGCRTLAASSGEEALELACARSWRFDAVVSDYRLGAGLNGVEAAKELARLSGREFRPRSSPATRRPNISQKSRRAASNCCTSRSAPSNCGASSRACSPAKPSFDALRAAAQRNQPVDGALQILELERLGQKGRIPVVRRDAAQSVAGDEGEGNAVERQRVGDRIGLPALQRHVQQGPVEGVAFPLDDLQRRGDGARRAEDLATAFRQPIRDEDREDRVVIHQQQARRHVRS